MTAFCPGCVRSNTDQARPDPGRVARELVSRLPFSDFQNQPIKN